MDANGYRYIRICHELYIDPFGNIFFIGVDLEDVLSLNKVMIFASLKKSDHRLDSCARMAN